MSVPPVPVGSRGLAAHLGRGQLCLRQVSAGGQPQPCPVRQSRVQLVPSTQWGLKSHSGRLAR